MFLWLFVNSVFQKSYKWPSAGSEWTGSNFSQKLLPDPLDSRTVVIYPFGGRCLIFIFTFGSRVERKASIQQDPQIALTHISERLHPFSCFSLSPQTPETEEINLNLHTYILITVTCSYIILFVYLFSLCSTALYSCITGERNMEMSAAVTGELQPFDARSSAARLGVAVEKREAKGGIGRWCQGAAEDVASCLLELDSGPPCGWEQVG